MLVTGNDPVTMLPGGTDADEFVEWWRARKRDPADAPVLRRVSAAITGHEMLDEHGVWERVDGLGEVWLPKDLPRNWAPYRYGHWRWIGQWGWTWIDDMPWGFATSHFGRWADIGESDGEAGPDRGCSLGLGPGKACRRTGLYSRRGRLSRHRRGGSQLSRCV